MASTCGPRRCEGRRLSRQTSGGYRYAIRAFVRAPGAPCFASRVRHGAAPRRARRRERRDRVQGQGCVRAARGRRSQQGRSHRPADLVRREGRSRISTRRRAPSFVLLRGVSSRLQRRGDRRSVVRDGPVGDRDDVLASDLVGSRRGGFQARPRGVGESERARGVTPTRARPRGRDGGVLPFARGGGSESARADVSRRRRGRHPRSRARVRAGHGASPRAPSPRRRGDDVLRPRAPRDRAADRQDVREPTQGDRAPRAVLRLAAEPPRRRALLDSRLRLSRARDARLARGARVRGPRAVGASRAPHAVAHLHAARPLGRVDREQPSRQRTHRIATSSFAGAARRRPRSSTRSTTSRTPTCSPPRTRRRSRLSSACGP